jgi:hypothetical protein
MKRWLLSLALVLTCGFGASRADSPKPAALTAIERGREAVRGRPALNPATWSMGAYETAWKQWGLAAKPADYERAFRERYGLHAAPYENRGLPIGLHEARGLFSKGVATDCLLCHAGRVAGQTVIGVGNAAIDLQGLFEELTAGDAVKLVVPFRFSHGRGTVDPVASLGFLMEFRDPDLNLRKERIKLGYRNDVSSDPPAWWLLKKKRTRGWNGGLDARAARVDMVNLLSPLNGPDYIKKQEPVFADIHAFVTAVESPRYPFPIDRPLARKGEEVFVENCAKCHGTYGEKWSYPNKVVPLETIGTDRTLAEALTEKEAESYNESWFGREAGPDGRPFRYTNHAGYQAPPLDGVWATAPYFHNGSVPTVYHVLNSKARPTFWTRSYATEKEDYDPARLGWKVTALDRSPDAKLPGIERRKVYDATEPGRGNGGHTFGDDLTEPERTAVIEYLKML